MAEMQAIYTWAFILAVITSHGIISSEGRQLKPTKEQGGAQTVLSTKETYLPRKTRSLELSAVAEPIDDFRPTTPGNSPGVGHSYTENGAVVQPNGEADVRNLVTKKSKQESTRKQKARSGMGKHGTSVSLEKTSGLRKNEVQVTLAYNNHHFENTVASKKNIISPANTQIVGFSTAAKSIDGYRPTAPGNSPGVGHSYARNDVKVKKQEVGNSPNVSDFIPGNTNDLKKTEPGHSPGVGHSSKDKNTEPNA